MPGDGMVSKVVESREGFVVVSPPQRQRYGRGRSVFLAGNVETGKSRTWKDVLVSQLEEKSNEEGLRLTVFGPQRKEWERSWEHVSEGSRYREQMRWEFEHMEEADVVVVYVGPATSSFNGPLELGLFAKSGRLVVYCPLEFWKKGNVSIFCERYGVTVVETEDELAGVVMERLEARRTVADEQNEDRQDDWRHKRVKFRSSSYVDADGKKWWSRGVNKWVTDEVFERMRREGICMDPDGEMWN
jgi:hypothetical protein